MEYFNLSDLSLKIYRKIEALYIKTFSSPPRIRQFVEFFRIVFLLYPKYSFLLLMKLLSGQRQERPVSADKRYVTFDVTHEGIGGQLSRMYTAIIFARKFDLEYVHRDLAPTFHDPKVDWQSFLRFGDGEPNYKNVANDKTLKTIRLPEFNLTYCGALQEFLLFAIVTLLHPENNIIFILSRYSYFPAAYAPDLTYPIYRAQEEKYLETRDREPVKSVFKKGKLNIVTIIRRGDIVHLGKNTWTLIDESWFVAVLRRAQGLLGHLAPDVHIFTDAVDISELRMIQEFITREMPGITVHLRGDKEQSFQAFDSMVRADILVCSLSGFCIHSGILSSKGIKIYPYVDHLDYRSIKNSPLWIKAGKNGNFDTKTFLNILKELGKI